ncbi:16S rRNA (guanine(966)-N(2))-methyltransferase RsmD [Clostridium chauvoei]|uniref:16S rRNA (Guanine(966)-N(2))-methyltransferase RsmD n=2 Tax=Clostridium chauvoei TaxID=46867 RepID=A0ABD4RGG6_9CLOT|nr:16S rRNA (guanine(966)-N(2))-methyltransferase RsmD [Clostridium chauvoei]ATD54928.1 16S rRNA (guanine(966)-N(2))-methyltransferase RsmD [Clostridium chauvoei]ATD57393.1 16S rRNA (guanine(966)-N(2))-methyltransferase RsmD [Clostridium chauvoei]MBX7280457.1 16S rRNA (guanine(966)-N(2))-methyltransferase RsmD [Clostridium chauvoei]MBX7282942.1 16S rRNA (guanine(966)-N(2))-methyltransferase RsmD [Clostridium chauvoei]MBX7285459.1 16S rRNA (guanine(966)-N(2))-methyltransferase RsmD [Clostridium
MRIIAGKARGRKLIPPATMETRPTLDRVKEAMFSMVQGYIPDAVVIDVFAGTGSLGLEAASRGAKEVYLVDKSPVTFPLLKENIENLKFEDFCFGLNMDSYEALRTLTKKGKVFDIIFIDPPYCKEMIPEAIKLVKENNMLKENGIIVTKIDTIEDIYEGYENIVLTKSRKYGNTTVCFYKYQ